MAIGAPGNGTARQDILRGVYEDNLRTKHGTVATPGAGLRARRAWSQRGAGFRTGVVAGATGLLALLAMVLLPALSARDAGGEGVAPRRATETALSGTLPPDAPGDAAPLPDAASYDLLTRSGLPLASLFDLQVRTIVIDPGHGGRDPGAVGHIGIREKDITLDVARRLRYHLERRTGYRVLLTREGDTYVSLRDRVEFANEQKADLFVSIHVNYLPVEPATVIETFYFGPQSDQAALSLAEKENRESDYSVADFDEMIQKIGNTLKLQESKRMAVSIQKSMYRNIRGITGNVENWGVKTAPFVVLLGADAPSVLAEIACLSNRAEEIKLDTPQYREQLARSLEQGVVHYLRQRPHPNVQTEGSNVYAAKEE